MNGGARAPMPPLNLPLHSRVETRLKNILRSCVRPKILRAINTHVTLEHWTTLLSYIPNAGFLEKVWAFELEMARFSLSI